jgi:hypothetical protein
MVILPVLGWDGDMDTEKVPDPGSVALDRLKLLALEFCEARVLPFGSFRVTVTLPILLLVACTVTDCPDAPLNVSKPTCPGCAMVTGTELPLMLIEPFTSAGTS